MGIILLCDDEEYSCGYSRWDVIREELANASVRHLRAIYDVILEEDNPQNAYIQTEVEKLLDYIGVHNCCTVADFGYLFIDKDFVNTFIFFNVGGIFALLNKSDAEGYYSVGNSVDIVKAIEIIEPHILLDDVKDSIYHIKKVFHKSVSSEKIIHIC